MPPPTMPRCAGWRCGRRATRRPPRPGARKTAPTVFFSTSKAPRICSAARRSSSPILPRGCEISACRRGLPLPRHPARPGRCRAFTTRPSCVLPSGQEAEALAPLPIEALRLAPETRTTLRRLGFKSVGALIDKPRAPFAARFAAELLRRLDQALGRVDEPLVPIVAPPVYHSLHYLIDRSSPRRPSSPVPTASCRPLCMCWCATMSARARCGFRSTASMAQSRRSISG